MAGMTVEGRRSGTAGALPGSRPPDLDALPQRSPGPPGRLHWSSAGDAAGETHLRTRERRSAEATSPRRARPPPGPRRSDGRSGTASDGPSGTASNGTSYNTSYFTSYIPAYFTSDSPSYITSYFTSYITGTIILSFYFSRSYTTLFHFNLCLHIYLSFLN